MTEPLRIIPLDEHVDRFFDDSSRPDPEEPVLLVLFGGIAAGKTRRRREKYSTGYVTLDAGEIFRGVCPGDGGEFPGPFVEAIDGIGYMVASRALRERRSIVVEFTAEPGGQNPITEVIPLVKVLGYRVSLEFINCDPDVAWNRYQTRAIDNVSSSETNPFHRQWLIQAAEELLKRESQPQMSSASAAQIVKGILDRYIAIHDQIVKFSISKILPIPGIFKSIQYCKHQEELKGLETELAGARGAIRLAIEAPDLALAHRHFLEALDLYAGALNDAIILLGRVSSELCLKSRNEGDYPWHKYQRDMQAYRAAVHRYSELGKELNMLYSHLMR